jgi:hypothetical protein
MKRILTILILISVITSCLDKKKKEIIKKTEYLSIINLLERMVMNEQRIMYSHKPNETKAVKDSLYKLQGEILKANTDSIKHLFKLHGFLGFDKVGKNGSKNFWLLVQHSDHDIAFQEKVLKIMKVEVEKKNANSTNFAFLTDRVLKNKGEKQFYGTQLKYIEDFWVISQPTIDSVNVNARRKEIGLSTIEEYWNSSMELNYKMNKEVYKKNGLNGSRKYRVKK